MITSNAFMTAKFGERLISEWLPSNDVTHVINTEGAYIPGHGTPTLILFGRNRAPFSATIRAVMGVRGEPGTPSDPALGLVWRSIVQFIDRPGEGNDFVTVADLERVRLYRHPWSIGGGGAAELKDRLDAKGTELRDLTDQIGFTGQTNIDDVFLASLDIHVRYGGRPELIKGVVRGTAVRDWIVVASDFSFFPYEAGHLIALDKDEAWYRRLWPFRTTMWARATFSKRTYRQEGRPWWEWHQVSLRRLSAPVAITYSFVSTHNHFALDSDRHVFNRTAPALYFAGERADENVTGILGALNSSVACFWLKQVCFNKGSTVDVAGARQTTAAFENFYNFDTSKLEMLPIPSELPILSATRSQQMAIDIVRATPVSIVQRSNCSDLSVRLDLARKRTDELVASAVGMQEQLDWETYQRYGLLDDDLTSSSGDPPLRLGQRAFEIVLARRMAAGEESTTWFERHGSSPITDLPREWPEEYRGLVDRRIEMIETNPEIALIERPEYKRRWATTPWDVQQADALRSWLLDRLESPAYWPSPAITSTARLASVARADEDFMTVARLYAGRDDVDVAALVAELVKAEAVPYLAALRYTDSGMRKYGQWCETWALQRREDAGEEVGEIAVPPKYAKVDFTGVAWTHRGKLDVPKERFISCPGAERENDPSLPVGWAGWDHLERARALATFYLGARRDGRDVSFLTPLLAGLAELVPWLVQWYDEPSADPALDRPGSQIAALVESELRVLHLTADDLAGWRPAPTARGRPRR